jgi:predicted DNA-binding protein with PD1-like motif
VVNEQKEVIMKTKLITQLITQDKEKTHAIIFDDGDEFMHGMWSFAEEQGISAAHFTAIGAFSKTTLGYYDMDQKEYQKIPVNEQVEVLSLMGDIALKGEEVEIHAHVVAAGLMAPQWGDILWRLMCAQP